ncbi:MAG: cupin domain-containing protein [Chloroflexi bacterium]|nr:cupin domain-containing protein [Chloroflexota bacterium]
MKKAWLVVVLGMVVALITTYGGVSLASHEGPWPPVKVDLSVQQEGSVYTAIVWIKNEGHFDADLLNVKVRAPKGAKYVDSWAGSGRGFNAGKFDGSDVSWVNPGVKAGSRQGPFVYIFDAGAAQSSDPSSLVWAWISWAGTVPGSAVSKAVSIQTPSPVLDLSVGTPPAMGWKWKVGEITADTEEVIDGPQDHGFNWMFFVAQGASELSTVDGKRVLSRGEGVLVPARQEHTHRHLPQSRIVAFDLRAADDPPGAVHRGRQILISDAPVEVTAGLNYRLLLREFTLSPGVRTLESVTVGPNFVYVEEGTLTMLVGDSVISTEAGKVSIIPMNVKHIESNEGTTPLRFIVVDVRP